MCRLSVLMILLIPTLVWGNPSGAPPESCATMMPQHGVLGETVSCPFSTVPTQMTISWDQQVTVTLRSEQDEKFKGFLMIAFDENNQTIGTFDDDVIQPVAKPITCLGLTDIAATHADATDKDFVNLVWSPPIGFTGYVLFRTTFVMDAYNSWEAIPATNLIQVIETSTTSVPTTTSSQSTTPAPFICPGDGFYAVPGLCVNYYYLCIGIKSMLQRCSGDLLFDPFYLSCQSPDKVTCLATESPTSPADLPTNSMSTSSTEMTSETTTEVPVTSTESSSSLPSSIVVTGSTADSSKASTDSYTSEESTLSTPEVTTNPTDSTTVPSASTEDTPIQTTSFELISTTSNINDSTTVEDSTTSTTAITTNSSSTSPVTTMMTTTTKTTTNSAPKISSTTSTISSISTVTSKSTTSSANALISASKWVIWIFMFYFWYFV